jgi:four helix bundle protein
MYQYNFEKLEVWNLSIELDSKDLSVHEESFQSEEKFGITNQLEGLSNSVSANIAEGSSSRLSKKDKARFIQIAYSSLMEVLNFLIIAVKIKFHFK